jgi:hypothetical protein
MKGHPSCRDVHEVTTTLHHSRGTAWKRASAGVTVGTNSRSVNLELSDDLNRRRNYQT